MLRAGFFQRPGLVPCLGLLGVGGVQTFGVGSGLGIVHERAVDFELLQLGGVLPEPGLEQLHPGVQGGALVKLVFQRLNLPGALGDQTGAVVAAAVFQLPELRAQDFCRAGVVAGGDQCGQTAAQAFIGRGGQLRQPQKARPAKDALFHA